MNIRLRNLFALLVIVSGSCFKRDTEQPVAAENETVITIHLDNKKQTIRNFGASDAWACNFIGVWPDEQRNQVADWLFSTAVDEEGKPKGIGLSLWRFNIGAGSAAQDNIADEWRRTEGFLKDDLTYDWNKQAGQQWFLDAAKARGVDRFVGFTNSPPVQLTKNKKAFSSDGQQGNIAREKYDAFAVFLATVARHFQEKGIVLNYLSPFNEPQWDWTSGSQEGTPYTNQEMFDITRKLDSIITKENLPTKIQVAEAGSMVYLYGTSDKPTRSNQIEDFFSQGSTRFLGGFNSVDKMISGHSYFTSAPVKDMISVRQLVNQKIKSVSVPLEFWQSEYCILGDQEEVPGPGKDTGMVPALYVARLIHHDLTVANASAWHWWTSLSVYDYKDGLVYADKNKTTGKVEDTKLLWAFGNFSRFIRPGAQRVEVTSQKVNINNPVGLMASSYVNAANNEVVTVIINYSNIDETIRLDLPAGTAGASQLFITSGKAGEDLKPLNKIDGTEAFQVPKTSIVTLVTKLL